MSWINADRHRTELKIARGNRVLVAVFNGERHVFCCRETDVFGVMPEGVIFHIELATYEEAERYMDEKGAGNRWIAMPEK